MQPRHRHTSLWRSPTSGCSSCCCCLLLLGSGSDPRQQGRRAHEGGSRVDGVGRGGEAAGGVRERVVAGVRMSRPPPPDADHSRCRPRNAGTEALEAPEALDDGRELGADCSARGQGRRRNSQQ